ncbi:RNA polymerase sigma factor [Virgibacillus doumboii]|uniref:RNA polymerase sigma factor n=1 Tax=Virgibacillus doumboii TaxID=2697503 RepID=UPI0013DF0676|nr:sigma-70 family RNA polymerase sigma factor [Virgibacillus doumboii]
MKEFTELYRLYPKELYNYLFHLTKEQLLAEELVQETFYQAYKSIHRFKGNSSIKTWLYQIGKNVYYKHLIKNPTIYGEFNENDKNAADLSTPPKVLEMKEQEQLLLQSIKQLNWPYNQVIILRSFNDLSFKEIGDIFLKSENWARVTFHRGKHKLKEIIKRGEEFDK